MVSAYATTLVACAAEDSRIVALDADLALDGLLEFEERYADRFVDAGSPSRTWSRRRAA